MSMRDEHRSGRIEAILFQGSLVRLADLVCASEVELRAWWRTLQ